MTKADCLPCRIGKSHTFHDDGSPNLAYAYEGTEPPVQDSITVEKDCPLNYCVLKNGHDGAHRDYRTRAEKVWADLGGTDQNPRALMRQAEDLVYGDRQGAYGHPYDDYSRTAGMWSSFLGIEITPAQAALMMVLLKISRERNRPKDDNIVDAHGYLLCYGRIQGRDQAS